MHVSARVQSRISNLKLGFREVTVKGSFLLRQNGYFSSRMGNVSIREHLRLAVKARVLISWVEGEKILDADVGREEVRMSRRMFGIF